MAAGEHHEVPGQVLLQALLRRQQGGDVRGAARKPAQLAVGIGPFVVGPVIEKKIGLAAFGAMSVDADWREQDFAMVVVQFPAAPGP